MNAKLKVIHAGPLVSVQDTGRRGHLRFGVSGSGAMDSSSYALANAALNQPESNPAIEVSLGGITLNCLEGSIPVSIVGGNFSSLLNDVAVPSWALMCLHPGDTLAIRPGEWGSWCYLAFAGQIDSNSWLNSQSVHIKSGVCGSAIHADDILSIRNVENKADRALVSLGEPDMLKPKSNIRVVVGPQDRFFKAETLDNLLTQAFQISADYDRMGMRLSGCSLPVDAALVMPSEPILRGSLQVPGHGDPICLMADHHTAGGYPKIATVISADLDALAQHRSGESVRFTSVSANDAVLAARERHKSMQQWRAHIMLNAVGLTERLWNTNLISGAASGSDE